MIIVVLLLYSLLQMSYTNLSLISLVMLIKLVLLYIIGFKLNLRLSVFIWSYAILALGAIVEFGLALYYKTFTAFTLFPRASSLFMPLNNQDFGSAFDPNNFGIYIVLLFLIIRRRYGFKIPALCLLVPVILTGSKIALILTMIVIWHYYFRYLIYTAILFSSLYVTVMDFDLTHISDNVRLLDFKGQSDRSTEDRWDRIVHNAYFEAPLDILVFGAGFQALRYKNIGVEHQEAQNLYSNSHYNQFLAILFDFGAIGGLLAVVILILVFMRDRFLFICFFLLGLTGEYFYNEMIALISPSLFFYDTSTRKIFI
ncbi:MAG: hypothetical protein ACON5K_10705 [Bacteroidia bacterium]